ncbi:hypothetical protein [Tsuneonella suprasediminis]|uniref:hypothetical protein n=1 Tax=Tsuneonella suprasediminis TaxID=2306996 RepID=UPI002F924AEC
MFESLLLASGDSSGTTRLGSDLRGAVTGMVGHHDDSNSGRRDQTDTAYRQPDARG